jgi:uncharacterized membrane protein YccC
VATAAAARPGLIDSVRPRDPDRAGLRRALRAAILLPPLFAFASFVIRDPQLTTFVSFGFFSLSVMADFGGPRPERAVAYLATIAVGAVLVTIGTLASPIPWLALLAVLVVGFAIQFATVFGSYAAAAQPALMLAFVLAVSVQAPPTAVLDRLEGYVAAGAVATLAGLFLWPRFEVMRIKHKAALACRSLAALIAARRWGGDEAEIERRRQQATDAIADLRRAYRATPRRPAGPTRRDRAFAELVLELERALDFIDRRPPAGAPPLEHDDRLPHVVIDTLQACASALEGGPPPDLLALMRARAAHREAIDRWAFESLRNHVPPEQVLDVVDADYALRIFAYLTVAIASNVVVAIGGEVSGDFQVPMGTPRLTGVSGVATRILRTIRTHLEPSSSVLHNSLRVGIGLALAVALARVLQLSYAFWVVLGAVSVLRTTALATGRTTLEAMAGTVLGFGVGALFAYVVGSNAVVLWATLPLVVFFAAYASSAIGFIVGQAAFTIYVIIFFNLLAPVGWRLGIARVEDVAVGVGASVAVALLLWPRGARAELRRSLAVLYRAAAAYVAVSMSRITDGGSHADAERARSRAVMARDRAGEAYNQFLDERGAKPVDPSLTAMLVAAGTHAITIGDLVNTIADRGDDARGCSDGAAALRAETRAIVDMFESLADRLEARVPDSIPVAERRVSAEALRSAALRCLEQWKRDPDAGQAAMAVVTASDLLRQLDTLCAGLEEPAADMASAARIPWWR